MGYRDPGVYRPQALRHVDVRDELGRPLRLSRGWVDATYWLVCAVGLGALLWSALADVGEYARGPAIVRVDGRTAVTAAAPGVVAEVVVAAGARVQAGQVLVRLGDDAERTALSALDLEVQTALAELLRDPGQQAARERIAGLVAQQTQARQRVAERDIVAPHAGIVTDARVRMGQAVTPGETLMTIAGDDGRPSLVALVPGEHRPLLSVGMSGWLKVGGFSSAPVEITIDEIGQEVIGPAEAARFLGPERADSVQVPGGVVIVRARLRSDAIELDDRVYPYYDGMQGQLEVQVRRQSVLTTLVPGLRQVYRRWNP